eukprot:g16067.t1
MMRSRVDQIIDTKFTEGFKVIEGECKNLFARIRNDVDARAATHEKEAIALVDGRSAEMEGKVNARCKDLIQMKMSRVERDFYAMCAKSFQWSIDSFHEKMLNLYNVKENVACLASPTFTLATCPKMYLELTVENMSRGSHTNEWAPGGGLNGSLAGFDEDGNALGPTPIAGNFSLVLYFEKRVDVLKLKVTVGPPETEVTRVVSHKDFDARLWDRRHDSVPVKVEILEAGNRKRFRKRIKAAGLNFGKREPFQCYDQFLSPNYLTLQVSNWVSRVKYKHLKRATWQINNVQEVCRLVPTNCCIESNIFRIAGLDALRLVLYPNGLEPDLPMQAALFLRSVSEENGSVSLGRRKFASLLNVDAVLITVEIEECADEALNLYTVKKFEKLEDVYRLPEAGGVSTYANTGTFHSRPTTVSSSGMTSAGGGSGLGALGLAGIGRGSGENGGGEMPGSRPPTN